MQGRCILAGARLPHVVLHSDAKGRHSLHDRLCAGWLLIVIGGGGSVWKAAAVAIRTEGLVLEVLHIFRYTSDLPPAITQFLCRL